MKMLGHAARRSRACGLTRWCRMLPGLVGVSTLWGCGVSTLSNQNEGAAALPRRDTQVTHAACDIDGSGAKLLDANGNGRADVIVGQADSGQCQAYDLNLDGGIDSWVYRDNAGRVVRREFDFDRDGLPEEIQLYASGSSSERHQSITVRGRLDTWHFYRAGKLVRTERDANGDGIIDQWWSYPKPECPVIQSDTNADGKPNPDSTIDLCKAGDALASGRGADHLGSRTFERPGASPSEVQPGVEQESTEEPAEAEVTDSKAEPTQSIQPSSSKAGAP